MKEAIRTIVWVVGVLVFGALAGMALGYLHNNSRIMQILVSDLRRITAPLMPIIEPVLNFIVVVMSIFWGVCIIGGCLMELYDRLRRRKAARADKHKRAHKAERQDKHKRAPVKHQGKHQPKAERQDKLATAWAAKYDREKVRKPVKRAPVKRIYQSQHRSEADAGMVCYAGKWMTRSEAEEGIVFFNGKWWTRSEAAESLRDSDRRLREAGMVLFDWKWMPQSEAASALASEERRCKSKGYTPEEWRQYREALLHQLTPDEWMRILPAFKRKMVYRNGQWTPRLTIREHELRADLRTAKRLMGGDSEGYDKDEFFIVFTPDEWRRLGDLREPVKDGSMGIEEAHRLLYE